MPSRVRSHIVTELTKPPFAREVPRNEAEGVPLGIKVTFISERTRNARPYDVCINFFV